MDVHIAKLTSGESLDQKIDRIDDNISKLVVSLDRLVKQGEEIENLQERNILIEDAISNQEERIYTLEEHRLFNERRIRVLQMMSYAVIVIASIGAIFHFIEV